MSMKYGLPIQIKEIKAVGDDWLVEGYASTFGNVDFGFDVVMPGAFDKTLADGHKISFLHSHDPRLVLGIPKKFKVDKKGLFGSFKISKTTLGADTRELLIDEAMGGFSIGYSTKDSNFTEGGVRQLLEVELFEVSVVAMPMNPEAIVTNVKDYLASIGISADMTLAEKAAALQEGLAKLVKDTTAVVGSAGQSGTTARPLSNTKRQELTELLEMFSGLDAVRSDLQSVLAAAPLSVVGSKRAMYELAEARKRLARVYEETS